MKTKVRLTGLLAIAGVIFACSQGAKAENPEYVNLLTYSNMKVAVMAQNPQKQSMSIEIINSSTSESVYSADLYSDAHFGRLYNLSNLPEGSYTVSFRINDRVYEKELLLQGSRPELLTETKYSLPAFHQDANNLTVTVSNPKEKDVRISFWKDSESFFTDKPDHTGSFKRNYNLKNLDPGLYSVEVLAGNEDYSHSFEIK